MWIPSSLALHSLAQGLLYWDALAPLGDRWKDIDVSAVAKGSVSRDEMVKARVLSDKEFGEELECYWQELKLKVAQTRQRRQNRLLGLHRRRHLRRNRATGISN